MNLRTILLASTAALSLAAFAGCDDGSESTNNGGGGSTPTGGGGTGGTTASTPPPPELGAQIDRKGRPAINTATNNTFNTNPEQADAAKDEYNENKDISTWGGYAAEIGKNLAILDGLDAVCGNQLLADDTKDDPSRYATLAGALADDRLYVNSAATKSSVFLAVEANATKILENSDGGGRRLSYDVIDITYSVVAIGMLTGVTDGVDISDAAKGETFPHLAAPHPPP